MKNFLIPSLFALLLSATNCSPFMVKSDFAATENFNNIRTYKIRMDDLKLNDIDKDRVLNEISKNLQMKGLNVSNTPDIIVDVKAQHKKIRDIQQNNPIGMWGWGGPYGWGVGVNRTFATNYNQGSLIIEFRDANTQKLVWQGIGEGLNVDKPSTKQKQIPILVEQILKQYPPSK